MKKLLFFTIIILCSFNINSQTPKELRKANKIISTINFVNRGIDFNKTFVPICKGEWGLVGNRAAEAIYSEKMFAAGLEVGTYHTEKTAKDASNREINLKTSNIVSGDYTFEVTAGGFKSIAGAGQMKNVVIKDLNNNNKMVGSFSFKLIASTAQNQNILIPIFKAFIESK